MDRQLGGLDHLMVAVTDLEAGADMLARLGFRLTATGHHPGWRTRNRCVMFPHDYLELLTIDDPGAADAPAGLRQQLDMGDGLFGIALKTANAADTVNAWSASGFASATDQLLSRQQALVDDSPLRFHNAMLNPAETIGLTVFACHHLTPERMRMPDDLRHPNSVQRIASAVFAVDAVADTADLFGRILGPSQVTWTDQIVTAHVGATSLLFCAKEDVAMLQPDVDEDALDRPGPFGVGITFEVADPGACELALAAGGLACRHRPDGSLGLAGPKLGLQLDFRPSR